MTIEGGPGWVLDAPPPDVLGQGAPAARPPLRVTLGRHRTALAAALALAVGFGSATMLAEWRTERLGETDAGALSVEVNAVRDGGGPTFGRSDGGRLTMTMRMEVRNTGPRDIELRQVRLEGTAWVAADARGRRLARGDSAWIGLMRAVDCTDLPAPVREWDMPALTAVVTALTGAGERQRRAEGALEGWLSGRELDRQACGELEPAEAVQAQVSQQPGPGSLALHVQLANGSRHDLTLTRGWVPEGLRLEVLDGTGAAPAALPVRLPAGDFGRPRPPQRGAGPVVPLVLRVTVADCARLRPVYASEGQPLVQLDVASDRQAQMLPLGDLYGSVQRLRAEAC